MGRLNSEVLKGRTLEKIPLIVFESISKGPVLISDVVVNIITFYSLEDLRTFIS